MMGTSYLKFLGISDQAVTGLGSILHFRHSPNRHFHLVSRNREVIKSVSGVFMKVLWVSLIPETLGFFGEVSEELDFFSSSE